jgi:hypothetical protein
MADHGSKRRVSQNSSHAAALLGDRPRPDALVCDVAAAHPQTSGARGCEVGGGGQAVGRAGQPPSLSGGGGGGAAHTQPAGVAECGMTRHGPLRRAGGGYHQQQLQHLPCAGCPLRRAAMTASSRAQQWRGRPSPAAWRAPAEQGCRPYPDLLPYALTSRRVCLGQAMAMLPPRLEHYVAPPHPTPPPLCPSPVLTSCRDPRRRQPHNSLAVLQPAAQGRRQLPAGVQAGPALSDGLSGR